MLLNGKRLAQFGGQTLTGFDLNALPISAIERVELLTDGASALYGADAIGGVVNFITKHNVIDGDVTIGYSSPADGAREKRLSATKGFGLLEQDGYNVVMRPRSADRPAQRQPHAARGEPAGKGRPVLLGGGQFRRAGHGDLPHPGPASSPTRWG